MAKFKTRARAVDMLGRQQIANVSTAISELFKNAHDAYADHVEADYFCADNLLVIRDDGVGMTKEEFVERWLVLGTESKSDLHDESKRPYRPEDKPERAIMGEKGIGRLAIALLGNQVLILTRARRDGKLHALVMCFIHWGVFGIPGLNLEDITIPVHTVPDGHSPTSSDVDRLIAVWRTQIETLRSSGTVYDFTTITKELDDFQVDPADLNQFLEGLSLEGDGVGTHFYIAPTNEVIKVEIEDERKEQNKEFSKFLLGFCNSTFGETGSLPIRTAFRYRPTDNECEDLVDPREFFTKEELSAADHRIKGEVDEYGQFKGTVRVYDQEHADHVIPWTKGQGRPTHCGPFTIQFGYLQGAQRESQMAPDEWQRLNTKLDSIGGLYVYRDHIRILPYGNSDVDWVDIEQRRTKGAGYYFFSYRRIFGAVCLTRSRNGALCEKSGREGFQRDKAYRQLVKILENLFMQLAADFFRKDETDSRYFHQRRSELERLELARRRREKQAHSKRSGLTTALDGFFNKTSHDLPAVEVNELRTWVNRRVESAIKLSDPDKASATLLDTEREANRKLEGIRQSYKISRPRGVGLSRKLQLDWDAYSVEQEHLEKEVFSPVSREIAETVGRMATQARIYVDQRRRLEELIRQVADQRTKSVRDEAKQLNETATETRNAALRTSHDAIKELQNVIAEVEADFARQNLDGLSAEGVEETRTRLESMIDDVGRRNAETLGKVRDMLAAIAENLAEGTEVSQLEMVEAMDEELQDLREQTDLDADLVQLGLAVAVINHEFEAAIKNIRATLRELRSWASANTDLAPLYQEIRNNFDHLDGHLNLFTPLQRRLYRDPIVIKGSEIYHYVKALFDVRLKRHRVEVEATDSFLSTEVRGYPSTIYPVFVNVMDNAIFWLRDVSEDRRITIDSDGEAYLIANNGPMVARRDYEAIFEQGFTRRPGGRGLGLFISRKALRKEGMDIGIAPSDTKRGVTFRIRWTNEHSNTNNS